MLKTGGLDQSTERIGEAIVDSAVKIHRFFGPGLLESVYEASLERELTLRRFGVERQVGVPLVYEGVEVGVGYRIDLWVERSVIVEVKSLEGLHPLHEAQALTYLKVTGMRLGFLLNFNVPVMKSGIKRFIR